ncbi:MAG: hypothetical protein PHR53_04980 [Bacteroidales bacterium]|nr:hypothetical protein [Bacteroidales bacterium]
MNIVKFIFVTIFFHLLLVATAQDEQQGMRYRGFSGGMMLHSGYLFGGTSSVQSTTGKLLGSQNMAGMPWGIGGCLRFHFGNHFRMGMEGHSTTLNYAETGSFFSLGWGGFLFDGYWTHHHWTFFGGGTIGGGRVQNLTLLESTPLDEIAENHSSYRTYGVMLITPFLGIEYAITPKIHLIAKADYLINVLHRQPDFVQGIRCYVGIVFQRYKH